MSAATATVDPLVSQPGKTIIFLARRDHLRLVIAQKYPIYGPAGAKVGENPGQTIPFRDGRFDCPQTGKVKLEDGREADAAEVLARLESHPLKDDVQEGFWRVDPTAPPVSREELDRLTDALVELDDVTLGLMLKQEHEGWQRTDLTGPLEKALSRIGEMQAAVPDPVEDPVKAKPGPKPKA